MKYIVVLMFAVLFYTSIFAQDEFFEPKTTIGGYGELHFNYQKPDGSDSKRTLDFHRFVLFLSHSWTEKWSFKAEVELEHNFVSEGQGELELEQAYVNYHYSDKFGFRAGVILPSVGLLNEYHEPPIFLSVERPDYHKSIIPTTWFGNGAAVYGDINGVNYQLTVMEGLNSDKFSAKSGIRGGRQKGYKADAEFLLYNARIDFLKVAGLKVGGSYTFNNAKGDTTEVALGLFELHAKYEANNIYFVGEYGNVFYNDGIITTDGIIEESSGFYFDLGYNVASLLKCDGQIIPFVRYSDINTASSIAQGTDLDKKYHLTKVMIGVAYKPISEVVFKFDYSQRTTELSDAKDKFINLGLGYMF